VTGKYWSKMYEIRVKLKTAEPDAATLKAVRQACIPRVHGLMRV
jgi:hypothetical protein